jgi:hypothetical protein
VSPLPTGLLPALGALAGAVVAAIGALVLGEYELVGVTPFVAGPLFGLAVAEAVTWASGSRGRISGITAAVLAAGGMVWAGWIDSGEGIDPMPVLVWPAAALAAVAAGWRAGIRGRVRG